MCRDIKFIFALDSEISTASPELASPKLDLIPEVCASNQIWILAVRVQTFLEFCVLGRKIETKRFINLWYLFDRQFYPFFGPYVTRPEALKEFREIFYRDFHCSLTAYSNLCQTDINLPF